MARQLTVTPVPVNLLAGQLFDDDDYQDVVDSVVDQVASIAPGLVVMRTTGGDRAAQQPPAVADAPSSIKTNIASAAGAQDFTTADFNGAIGAGRISPPAKLELTTSASANWTTGPATATGLDENGVPITDSIGIDAGGGTTNKGSKFFSRVLTMHVPAQGGAAGTATLGTSTDVTLDGGDVLGVSVHEHKALVLPAVDNNELYEQGTSMPVLRHGRIGVKSETMFRAGDVPMVRVTPNGLNTTLGSVRAHDNDAGTCVPFRRARYVSSGQPGDIGVLEVNL
jgi:hypothetical protein